MTTISGNTNNSLLPLLGQSMDTILISALFDTKVKCNSLLNIFLSVLKSIGKLGMILVIKSLFSGDTFKIENLFQKLIRIIFYKKMVLVDQKFSQPIIWTERTYEKKFQETLKKNNFTEHPDVYRKKDDGVSIKYNPERKISYLNFVHVEFGPEHMEHEEKKLKEYELKMKNRKPIVKAPKKYQRKYEESFQEVLQRGNIENPNPFAYKDMKYITGREGLSYLNFVHAKYGKDEMLEEEKNMLKNISTTTVEENFNEDYNFFLNIKAIFDKKEEPKEPFPVYLTKNGNYVLEYLPYFHNDFIKGVKNKVQQEYLESKNVPLGQTKCFRMAKILSNGFTSYIPKKLFPSKNYKKLTDMISNYFEICKMTENYEPLCVLINGKPGLGKSHFIEYISSISPSSSSPSIVCDNSIKIDMTEQTTNNLETIINETFASNCMGQGNTIILIDELDKYFDRYLKQFINNLSTGKIVMKDSLKKSKDNTEGKVEQKSEKITKEEIEEHKINIREEFLYSLLRVAEYDQFTHPVVILFVANNFDTIYDGVDMTHFKSLKSRFSEVQFESCDKAEIIDYLKYLNNTFFLNTKYYENDINNLITQIPDKIDIVYRELKQISFRANFQIKEIIYSLKNLDGIKDSTEFGTNLENRN